MKLNWDDVQECVPDPGAQVYVNHANCPAGADYKKRLCVKNTGDVVLAYCHHCTGHLVKSLRRGLSRSRVVEKIVQDAEKSRIVLPDDVEYNLDKWPLDARQWIYRCKLLPEFVTYEKWCYSTLMGRVIIPVYRNENLVFWQARNVGLCGGPKYLSSPGAEKPPHVYWPTAVRAEHVVVLTEDAASALRVTQDAGVPAMPLFGTALSDKQKAYLAGSIFESIVVWFDDDIPGRAARVKVINAISPCLMQSVGYVTNLEPKLLNKEDLVRIITPFTRKRI